MTVFFNSLKRLFKSKVQILVLFILPFITLIPTCLDNSGSMTTLKISVIDKDNTEVTKVFKESLSKNFNIVNVNEDAVESSVNDNAVNYAIVIPKGYTKGIINMKAVEMKGYANKDNNISPIMKKVVDGYINPVKAMAAASKGNSNIFYKEFNDFNNKYLKLLKKTKTQSVKKDSVVVYGMLLMFAMFTSVFASTIIITDKEKKTFFRTLNSGISVKSYMLQVILSFEIIVLLQIAVILAVTILGFHVGFGTSIINMLVLLFAFSIVSVSFGIAVSSIAKNTIQAILFGVGIITFMSLIGGAWGMTPVSNVVNVLSKLMPISWAVDGIGKLLNRDTLSSINYDIGMLLVFSAVFFLLGTWRKTDIAK